MLGKAGPGLGMGYSSEFHEIEDQREEHQRTRQEQGTVRATRFQRVLIRFGRLSLR